MLLLCALMQVVWAKAQVEVLQPGDLLFYKDTTGMGAAVRESTGEYTHVALVEAVGDTVWIIDATLRYGVSRRPLVGESGDARGVADVYRLAVAFDTAAVLRCARSAVGLPYDEAFLPGNGAYYCSELVCDCYGGLFETRPMRWRTADGRMPHYWEEHFKRIGKEVPEGVEGSNPTDLSRSALLRRVERCLND